MVSWALSQPSSCSVLPRYTKTDHATRSVGAFELDFATMMIKLNPAQKNSNKSCGFVVPCIPMASGKGLVREHRLARAQVHTRQAPAHQCPTFCRIKRSLAILETSRRAHRVAASANHPLQATHMSDVSPVSGRGQFEHFLAFYSGTYTNEAQVILHHMLHDHRHIQLSA